jgi:hypothetical protein
VKSSSRWLLIFGAAIGLLVIVAIVLVFTTARPGGEPLLPEDTPEGTVQRYLLALQAEDYITAYNYLSFPPGELISYEEWRERARGYADNYEVKVTLTESSVTDNEASVDVVFDVISSDEPFHNFPFGSPVSTHQRTFYLEQEGTSWKITSPTYVSWYFY